MICITSFNYMYAGLGAANLRTLNESYVACRGDAPINSRKA